MPYPAKIKAAFNVIIPTLGVNNEKCAKVVSHFDFLYQDKKVNKKNNKFQFNYPFITRREMMLTIIKKTADKDHFWLPVFLIVLRKRKAIMAVLIFFIAHWFLSLFTQTFFYHRYASHAAFNMSKSWERFFYILSYITQGSSYMSPHAYAIMHRMHHAYTDTEKDPHSPKYAKNVYAMMMRTNKIYMGIYNGSLQVDEKFTKNVPDWPAFDKWALTWTSSIFWSLLYTGYYIVFATAWWMYLLIPVHILMGPVHGTIVNWFAHKFGYTNFRMNNTAKNLLPVDLFMLGESYHNNHHKYPSSINFGGVRWYEIDPVYPVIRLLHWLKVIHIKSDSLKRIEVEF